MFNIPGLPSDTCEHKDLCSQHNERLDLGLINFGDQRNSGVQKRILVSMIDPFTLITSSFSLFLILQLLDLPGIIEGAKDGKGRGRQVIAGEWSGAAVCRDYR